MAARQKYKTDKAKKEQAAAKAYANKATARGKTEKAS